MTLSAYRLGLDAITGGALPVIQSLIRSLYRPAERDQSIDLLVPVLTDVIRNSRSEAYAEAATFLAETAADQGVDAPYIPAQSGYSEASVRSILREDLRGSLDEAAQIIAPKLIQHIEDSARQTMIRAVEDYREPGTREDADHYSYAALRGTDNVDRSFRESQARSWARVLTGAEDCAFCVLLASRGPVYTTAEDAGRLSASEAFKTSMAGGYVNSYHPNCVVPGTMVSGPPSQVGYRRHYEGEIVTLVTAGGNELSITPQHPVLTDRGWVPAGLVNEGDQLVSSTRTDRTVVSGPDVDHVPSRIEDVVQALSVAEATVRRGVPGSAEQFHGDGFDSEVEVVSVKGLLWDEVDPALIEPSAEEHFEVAPGVCSCGRLGGSGDCGLDFGPMADSGAPHGVMSGPSLCGSLVVGHSAGADDSGLAPASGGQSGLIEPAVYNVSGYPVCAGHAEHALSVGVTTGKVLGDGEAAIRPVRVGRKFDPPALDGNPETLRVFAELGADLLERQSGFVEFDRVVDKSVAHYSGHVLNLNTSEGWYTANGITVSNCDCLVVPVYNYASWPGRDQYRELDEFYQSVMKDPLWHGERTGTDPRSKDAPGSSGNPALAAIERELRHMAQQGESLPITDLRTGEPMRTASGSIAA